MVAENRNHVLLAAARLPPPLCHQPNQLPMNATLIAELPDSNLSCFEDRIQYGRLQAPQDTTISFADITRVAYQRAIHPFAIVSIVFALGLLLTAFAVFSSLWVRSAMTLLAAPIAITGLRGFFADQIIIVEHGNKRTVRNCYDTRRSVELFAATCTVAIATFRSSGDEER